VRTQSEAYKASEGRGRGRRDSRLAAHLLQHTMPGWGGKWGSKRVGKGHDNVQGNSKEIINKWATAIKPFEAHEKRFNTWPRFEVSFSAHILLCALAAAVIHTSNSHHFPGAHNKWTSACIDVCTESMHAVAYEKKCDPKDKLFLLPGWRSILHQDIRE